MNIDATLKSFHFHLPETNPLTSLKKGERVSGTIVGFEDGFPLVRVAGRVAKAETPFNFSIGQKIEAIVAGIQKGRLHLRLPSLGGVAMDSGNLLKSLGLPQTNQGMTLLFYFMGKNLPLNPVEMGKNLKLWNEMGENIPLEKFLVFIQTASRFNLPFSNGLKKIFSQFENLMEEIASSSDMGKKTLSSFLKSGRGAFPAFEGDKGSLYRSLKGAFSGEIFEQALLKNQPFKGSNPRGDHFFQLLNGEIAPENSSWNSVLLLNDLLRKKGSLSTENSRYFVSPLNGDPSPGIMEMLVYFPQEGEGGKNKFPRNFTVRMRLMLNHLGPLTIFVDSIGEAIKVRFQSPDQNISGFLKAEASDLRKDMEEGGYLKVLVESFYQPDSGPLLFSEVGP